jgi:hypothetical protein
MPGILTFRISMDHQPEQPADETSPPVEKPADWRLWPPSPKMQIVLIAAGFGLFNFMLLAIWAWVMIREFG